MVGTFEILAAGTQNLVILKGSSSFTIAKNTSNASAIDITLDGEPIKGVKIAEASNGFTFDIESQSANLDADEEDETIEGENFFELDGTKYHGFYDSSKKELKFAVSVEIDFDTDDDGNTEEIDVLIGVEGTKN